MAENRGGVAQSGDAIRSALKWLAEKRLEDPATPRMKLIEQAAIRFDLTPLDVDFLATSWKDG
jgi:hypothetical protein